MSNVSGELSEVTIRSIQHYMYCPHRWGLMEIEESWAENIFVTKANLIHERVHDPDKNYTARGKKNFTSVQVYNDLDPYRLFGVIDCLELVPDVKGVPVPGENGTYRLRIVEYKPTQLKGQEYREDDAMQVFAQKLCVDYVFGGECEGIIYYADVKKRIHLPLCEQFTEYDEKLKKLLSEMRDYREKGKVPPIREKQKCSGCSMKDLCMPTIKPIKSLHDEIKKIKRITL